MKGSLYLLFVCGVLLLITSSVSAAMPYIRSVTLSKDPLIIDQEFKIKIKVRNVESSMQVVIYFDDSVFPAKTVNVGPDLLDTEVTVSKDDWGTKINLKCGVHTMRADLVKYGEVYDILSQNVDVGNVPIMVLDPARPNPGQSLKISFTDRDTGEVLKNIHVTITDTDWNTENKDTGSTGYLIYTPSKPGKYELEITETKYCGEMYFYAKRNITLDGPKPERPMVGDMITINVPSSDIGLNVYDSNGDFYLSARTSITGVINFTINDPSEYLLVIGDSSTRYWGVNKTLTVSEKTTTTSSSTTSSSTITSTTTIATSTTTSTTTTTNTTTTTTITSQNSECDSNSDCPSDSVRYECQNGDVYQIEKDYSCESHKCVRETRENLFDACKSDEVCVEGERYCQVKVTTTTQASTTTTRTTVITSLTTTQVTTTTTTEPITSIQTRATTTVPETTTTLPQKEETSNYVTILVLVIIALTLLLLCIITGILLVYFSTKSKDKKR